MCPTAVETTHDGPVGTVTLASPQTRNALSRIMRTDLLDALRAAGADDAIRVVVLRAEGPAFCAGADLKEAAVADASAQREASQQILAVLRAIVELPVPVVAAVRGAVRAGGVGLVAACDLAIAAHDATFATTEVRLGLAPAIISAVVVPRLGDRDAARLLLGGETVDGAHAAAMGLVTSAEPADGFDDRVSEIVAGLAALPRQGLVATKALLAAPLRDRLTASGPALVEISAALFGSETAQAAMQRFASRP